MPRSKPRSARKRASSSPSTPPPELFCDRSLGRHKVPDRLRLVHPFVHAHDDLFPQDADDEVWLREAARNSWIVLTRDDKIRYRPGEQRVIIEAGVACFCLNPTKGMTADGWAEALVKALPAILRAAASERRRGYIKGVNRHGQVRHLFPVRGRKPRGSADARRRPR